MSAKNRICFTPRALNALAVPAGKKSVELTDEKVRNLKLEASAAGSRTFMFRAQRNGQRFALAIGHWPAMSVEEARKRALECQAEVDRGGDPSAQRRALVEEPTLRQFFEESYSPYAQLIKKSWRDDLGRFRHRIAPKFGDRKLSTLTRREIALYHAELKDELTPATANRILVLISAIYRKAVEWEVVTTNPASGIRQHRENNARTRFLADDEVARFLAACDEEPNQTGAAILKGLLLTGLRKSELQFARWSSVDLEHGVLLLQDTKNGDSRPAVLSDDAKALIAGLPSRGKSEWLFPGDDPTKAFVGLPKVFARVIARAQLAGSKLTIHSLRHSLASHLAMQGSSLHVVGQALGHRSVSMSARYAHLANATLKAAMDAAAARFRAVRVAAEAKKQEAKDEAETEPVAEPVSD